jgi:uroporphyrinogen decarboxylase
VPAERLLPTAEGLMQTIVWRAPSAVKYAEGAIAPRPESPLEEGLNVEAPLPFPLRTAKTAWQGPAPAGEKPPAVQRPLRPWSSEEGRSMAPMSKRERVAAALRGEPVDRPPISFWRHFFDRETSAAGLAEAMLGFQQAYDWDFMKVNPRACYHAEPWGCRFQFSGQAHIEPKLLEAAVRTPDDWRKITPLPPDTGALGEQLEALQLIKEGLRGAVPFVETIFTPLSVAARLTGSDEVMMDHLRRYPERVHEALEAIATTFAGFARACLDVGADGIFFATTGWATYERLTDADYEEFGRPYDIRVLQAVAGAPFNILHVCRSRNMLWKLLDYPAQAVNWATADPTNPRLGEVRHRSQRAVIGGVDHVNTLRQGTPEAVRAEVQSAVAQTRQGLFIGPGCSISPHTPEANLRAARRAVDELL